MRKVRATAAAVVLLFLGFTLITAPAKAQCVSSIETLSDRASRPRFLAGPSAWNGSILAVAGTELDRDQFQIILYNENGQKLATNENIRSPGSGLLDVLWNGADFGIFYKTEDGDLGLTRVGTNGKVIGPRILAIPAVPLEGDDTAVIVWSSQNNQYIVAQTFTEGGFRSIRATWIRRDGTVVRQASIDEADPDSFVRIAITTTDTIGIFYEDDKTGVVMYAAIRDEVVKKGIAIWTAGKDIEVATRGDLFAMVRPVLQTNGQTVVRWQIVDTSGEVVRRDSRLLIGTGDDVEPIALVAARGTEYALSYYEWPDGIGVGEPFYRLVRFGLDEEPISDSYFAAAVGTRRRRERTTFDFQWTGTSYISMASLENGDDDDTFLLRLCPLVGIVSAPRFARPQQPVTFTGSAEGGVPGYSYSWQWDDVFFAQGPMFQTSFHAIGQHTITLTVKDSTGATVTENFHVAIGDPKQRAVRK